MAAAGGAGVRVLVRLPVALVTPPVQLTAHRTGQLHCSGESSELLRLQDLFNGVLYLIVLENIYLCILLDKPIIRSCLKSDGESEFFWSMLTFQ